MKVLDHERRSWFLLESGSALLLDVHVSHGAVSTTLLLELDGDERAAYERDGRAALIRLAGSIQDSAPLAAASASPYRARDLTRTRGAEVTAAVAAWRAEAD